ncbi:LytR/AlgR family response regulator transcription factor [Sphingomonas sp. DT-207]|uniref:LytR/AlgR family response regulator transcription factor n=1 Tax=Sphingomonas sp. DT-207 TaxID=3396167 RepID=UPI003F1C4A4A
MIRTLIVDDEPLARRAVRKPLEDQADFAIVGEAGHGTEAVAAIEALRPDLVFLDVQMPEMDGFAVIEATGVEMMPLTVFVTAFDGYAVRAFEAQALDYLLKPFDDQRFARVLQRVRRQIGAGDDHRDRLRSMLGSHAPLVARGRGVAQLIRLAEIDWIVAAGDYAEVHAGGRALLLHESMASLEARLPRPEFARIHRSAIVRLDRLVEVRAGKHGDGLVRLACGTELRFSRRYREPIDAYLAR